MSVISYIGLGSNLGDSYQILQQAVKGLSDLGAIRVSPLYKSPPMGPQDQPDYYNAVVELETTLSPLELLDALQALEEEAGRVRHRRWGERTLDLDLLLYGNESIQHERLTVPHIGLLERDFVVLPLLDLMPKLSIGNQQLDQISCLKQASARVVSDRKWIEMNHLH